MGRVRPPDPSRASQSPSGSSGTLLNGLFAPRKTRARPHSGRSRVSEPRPGPRSASAPRGHRRRFPPETSFRRPRMGLGSRNLRAWSGAPSSTKCELPC
eukprot:3126834-Alexandrium_andersonii.AAC.1